MTMVGKKGGFVSRFGPKRGWMAWDGCHCAIRYIRLRLRLYRDMAFLRDWRVVVIVAVVLLLLRFFLLLSRKRNGAGRRTLRYRCSLSLKRKEKELQSSLFQDSSHLIVVVR